MKFSLKKPALPLVLGSVFALLLLAAFISPAWIRGMHSVERAKGPVIYSPSGDLKVLEDIGIKANFPDTATGRLLREWEKRAESGDSVEITKKDFELLKKALEDLDKRTAAFEKLPDGRIKIGNISTGSPTVVLQEHTSALKFYNEGNYREAYNRSKKAIEAFEATDAMQIRSTSEEDLSAKDIAKIYRLAVLAALNTGFNEEAREYAEKAVRLDASASHKGLLAGAYYRCGRYEDAAHLVRRLLIEEPNHEAWKNLKTLIEQASDIRI